MARWNKSYTATQPFTLIIGNNKMLNIINIHNIHSFTNIASIVAKIISQLELKPALEYKNATVDAISGGDYCFEII